MPSGLQLELNLGIGYHHYLPWCSKSQTQPTDRHSSIHCIRNKAAFISRFLNVYISFPSRQVEVYDKCRVTMLQCSIKERGEETGNWNRFGTPTLIQLWELEDSEASGWRACVSWGMRIRPTVFSSSSARVVSTHPLIDASPDFPFRCLIGCLCIPFACLSVSFPTWKEGCLQCKCIDDSWINLQNCKAREKAMCMWFLVSSGPGLGLSSSIFYDTLWQLHLWRGYLVLILWLENCWLVLGPQSPVTIDA